MRRYNAENGWCFFVYDFFLIKHTRLRGCADEAYGDHAGAVFSLKQLRSKSTARPASNLEDRETLAGRDAAGADVGGPATIIYTSGSTGTPKGILSICVTTTGRTIG